MALVVGLADALALLLLLPRPSPKEYVVDKSIFQECQEHEDEAAHEININSLDIGDLGQSLPQVGVDGCHGQHRGDPCEERAGALLPTWDGFLECCSQLPHPSFQLDCLRRDGSSATGNKAVMVLSPHAHYKLLQKMIQQQTAGESLKADHHQYDGDQYPCLFKSA